MILSAGTDGEDGPTDAAGALIDSAVMNEVLRRGLDPADYLRRNDAYHLFEPLNALVKTGPTNTNVCDLRVVLVDSLTAQNKTAGLAWRRFYGPRGRLFRGTHCCGRRKMVNQSHHH